MFKKDSLCKSNKEFFFARVEPPFMQEVHRSACAVFGRVSSVKKGENKTKGHKNNNKNTGQETLESSLEFTCMGETESETEVGQ